MPVHNADIAAVFEEIADLLEIEVANPFRIRAYRNAAHTLSELPQDARGLLEKGDDLTRLPGIGDDLAAKIAEIVTTGSCGLLQRLHKELPPAITELLHIPGLGPKRVRALYHDLDVQTVEQLYRAARDGCIRTLPGFGEKTELHILQAVEAHVSQARRFKLATAAQYAESLTVFLRKLAGVSQVTVAGSFRRMRETVGDLDILVTASEPGSVMQHFTTYDEVADVLSAGSTRASVLLKSGLQVDLRVVAEKSYGAALHYFTGCKAHNIAIRRIGQKLGLKINEYGVFRGMTRIAGETEESVYRAVGLPYIPPELREDRGEIEVARAGRLPQLVELADLRGDLHAHTKATDGHDSLYDMAQAAQALGFEYLAITEHSRRLTMAHGLDPLRLLRQCDEIDQLNAELRGITLLKGIEVDILEDGSLDLPDEVLSRLDLVVGAVHSKFELSRAKQTERILRAMEHPHFTLLAHPTGRLIEQRAPYDVDMLRIIRQAKNRGCFLELNAHPERLDLLDTYCQMAKDEGVLVSINSDAHSSFDFANLRFGVGQARRGWLEKQDVLNTRPLAELLTLIKRTMQRIPTRRIAMSTRNIPAGFRKIERHDGLFQEKVHDAYKAKGKLHEPSVCPQCGAFFHQGRWQWGDAPAGAHHETCPACHRQHDQFPAGFLKLEGPFFLGHKDEILRLVHHHAQRERAEHPLQRIMAVEDQGSAVLVTTTDIHLARGIGEAVHHAYQGELEFHYNPQENLLRVHWTH